VFIGCSAISRTWGMKGGVFGGDECGEFGCELWCGMVCGISTLKGISMWSGVACGMVLWETMVEGGVCVVGDKCGGVRWSGSKGISTKEGSGPLKVGDGVFCGGEGGS